MNLAILCLELFSRH